MGSPGEQNGPPRTLVTESNGRTRCTQQMLHEHPPLSRCGRGPWRRCTHQKGRAQGPQGHPRPPPRPPGCLGSALGGPRRDEGREQSRWEGGSRLRAEAAGRNARGHESRHTAVTACGHTTPQGEGSSDLMLVVTYSGPLPAPPSAPMVPRGSCPHPTPAQVCVLSPTLHTQQRLGARA